MAKYGISGNTQQLDVGHSNFVVAIKVDLAASPKFTVLAQAKAAANGDFSLLWNDWKGRTIVGVVDDTDTDNQRLETKFNDWLIPTTPTRITQDGDTRTTEDGSTRVLEG